MVQEGVRYTVITTTHDRVVVPYTNAYIHEPGVRNITLPSICRNDHTGHGNMTYDPNVIQLVVNELYPAHARLIECRAMPFIG